MSKFKHNIAYYDEYYRFNPHHEPAGSSEGGQFAEGEGGSGSAKGQSKIDIRKSKKGYDITTASLEIEIEGGKISATKAGGMPFKELDGKRFSDSEKALEFIKEWHKKQLEWADKNKPIGFG